MTEFDPTVVFGTLGLLIPAVVLLIVVLYLVPIPLWIAAWSSGAYVGLLTLVGMRLTAGNPSAFQSPCIAPTLVFIVHPALLTQRSTTDLQE